jgi:hypothetical protein
MAVSRSKGREEADSEAFSAWVAVRFVARHKTDKSTYLCRNGWPLDFRLDKLIEAVNVL